MRGGPQRDNVFISHISAAGNFLPTFYRLRDIPPSVHKGEKDLGWMLHDIDFAKDMEAKFFRAVMRDGTIEIPPFNGKEVRM